MRGFGMVLGAVLMRRGFYVTWLSIACALGALGVALLYLSACGSDATYTTAAQAQKSVAFLRVEQITGLTGYEPVTVYETAVHCRDSGILCCLESYRKRRAPGSPPDAVSYFWWSAGEFAIVLADGNAECDRYLAENYAPDVERCNSLRWQASDFRDCWYDRGMFA